MDHPAAILGEVLARVLRPAATGGALGIGRPFGPRRAKLAAEAVPDRDDTDAELRALLPASSLDAAEEAVVARMRRLAPIDDASIGPLLSREVVWLAALLHDAVAAFHPDLGGFFRGGARRQLVHLTIEALAEVPDPATVRGALLRHAWLGDLPRWSCARVEVRWWTGHASFVGERPPGRLLAWPQVRRVHTQERRVELMRLPELFPDRGDFGWIGEAYGRAMAAFLARSPLTDLALAARTWPAFAWTSAIDALTSIAAGARIARRAIASGEDQGKSAMEVIAAVAGDKGRALVAGLGSAA